MSGPPLRTASSSAQQATVGAMGPTESSVGERGKAPDSGTRCAVGLKPAKPQKAAGMRSEPPVSDPRVAAAMPSATDTAPPEAEPPGILPAARSHGAPGVP